MKPRNLIRLLRDSVIGFRSGNATPPISNDLMGPGVIDAALAVGVDPAGSD